MILTILLLASESLSLRFCLICRVELSARRLRHPNTVMLTGPSIFVSGCINLDSCAAPTLKCTCAKFRCDETSDKYPLCNSTVFVRVS